MNHKLETVIDELLTGNLSSGRRYEKLDASDNLYSVRLNQGYRFVFLVYPVLAPPCPSTSVLTTRPTGGL